MTVVAVVVLALLLLAAMLTAAETAAFMISPSRLRTLQEEGFGGADALARLRVEASRVRAGIRIATSVMTLIAVSLQVSAGAIVWGIGGATVNLVLTVVVVVAVTDLLPRTVAARQPVRLALLAAPPLVVLARWFSLAAAPIIRIEEALAGSEEAEVSPEERELREIQELGQEAGILEEDENLLVERAFRLDEMTAWDVMTPRVDVFAWPAAMTLDEIVEELPGVPYSRVPVFGESVDDVTGILYLREAYQAWIEGHRDAPLSRLAREPFFVPGSLSLSRLLKDFQARRIHMGIVADEFGGTDGLVTLEDVLEELVGEIVDETDLDEEEIVRTSRTELLADAGADLREINHLLNVSLPLMEHRSLNGYILEELGYVPPVGEALERGGVRIEIVEATETQVVRARVQRLPQEETPSDDG